MKEQISKYKAIAIIYDTYHIVSISEPIPVFLFTIEGVECLVKDNLIPREVATTIYKIMLENGENDNE